MSNPQRFYRPIDPIMVTSPARRLQELILNGWKVSSSARVNGYTIYGLSRANHHERYPDAITLVV